MMGKLISVAAVLAVFLPAGWLAMRDAIAASGPSPLNGFRLRRSHFKLYREPHAR